MMRGIFVVIFFAALGCVDKESIPKGIIQKDSMRAILLDMMLADQFAKQYILKDTSKARAKNETRKLYQEVFQLHHITKDEFQKSYQFYISRPDLAKPLFDSLSLYANNQRRDMYKPKPVTKSVPTKAPVQPPALNKTQVNKTPAKKLQPGKHPL
jgi:hypothetical protein